jgi:prolyl oligopeptidase
MKDAVSVVKQYDYSGKMLREIELPGLGSAGGFSGRKKEETLYYSFTNYDAGTTYSFKAKEISSISKPKVDFKSEDFESNKFLYF